MWRLEPYFKNNFFQVNDMYMVSHISKCGCSTVAAQTLLYHNYEKFKYEDFQKAQNKHLSTVEMGDCFNDARNLNCENKIFLQKVAIFRNPIERFISAVNMDLEFTKGKNITQILFSLSYIKRRNQICDQHFCSQSSHYNFDDIDLFVELKDYPIFCSQHNIEWLMINQNPNKKNIQLNKKAIALFHELYKEDYELIERIKQSNKLYIPNIIVNKNEINNGIIKTS